MAFAERALERAAIVSRPRSAANDDDDAPPSRYDDADALVPRVAHCVRSAAVAAHARARDSIRGGARPAAAAVACVEARGDDISSLLGSCGGARVASGVVLASFTTAERLTRRRGRSRDEGATTLLQRVVERITAGGDGDVDALWARVGLAMLRAAAPDSGTALVGDITLTAVPAIADAIAARGRAWATLVPFLVEASAADDAAAAAAADDADGAVDDGATDSGRRWLRTRCGSSSRSECGANRSQPLITGTRRRRIAREKITLAHRRRESPSWTQLERRARTHVHPSRRDSELREPH